MPGRITTTDVHIMLNNRFGAVAATAPPGTYYIGLSTTAPDVNGAGVTEPVGNGYQRVGVTNNVTNWPSATNRTKSNGAAFTFPTATGSWGVITHFVLYDALTGGTLRAYGTLNTPVEVAVGETRSFPIGSIVITAPSS